MFTCFVFRSCKKDPGRQMPIRIRGVHGYPNQNEEIETNKEKEIQSTFVHDPSCSVKVKEKRLAHCETNVSWGQPS